MKSIVGEIKKTNFNGIIIVASNPVDIMTYVVWKASGYDRNKIMGSGTTLDTAHCRKVHLPSPAAVVGGYVDPPRPNLHRGFPPPAPLSLSGGSALS